jgi:hypothetical protein
VKAPRKLTPELLEALAELNRQGIPATEIAVSRWIEEHAERPSPEQRLRKAPERSVTVLPSGMPPAELPAPVELEQPSEPEAEAGSKESWRSASQRRILARGSRQACGRRNGAPPGA